MSHHILVFLLKRKNLTIQVTKNVGHLVSYSVLFL